MQILSLFLGVLRCFSSPGSLPRPMCSGRDAAVLPAAGFPIRKSPVITLACSLPRLIAAGHVLLRLLAPRHPPCALSSLTFSPTILFNPKARMRTYKLYLLAHLAMRLSKSTFRLTESAAAHGRTQLKLVEMSGLEPPTPCVQSRCSPS